jgi:hypothetical protein
MTRLIRTVTPLVLDPRIHVIAGLVALVASLVLGTGEAVAKPRYGA